MRTKKALSYIYLYTMKKPHIKKIGLMIVLKRFK